MTRLHYVKKARKAIPETNIEKGDSYYWWQFAFRSKQVSKTHPRRSQYATQSEHLANVYDIEDEINAMTIDDIENGILDNVISQIEEIRDTCQERLDNMPEQLQYAPAGETLQSYIDAMDSWQQELEAIDLDIDDELNEEEIQERKESILEEIQSTSSGV